MWGEGIQVALEQEMQISASICCMPLMGTTDASSFGIMWSNLQKWELWSAEWGVVSLQTCSGWVFTTRWCVCVWDWSLAPLNSSPAWKRIIGQTDNKITHVCRSTGKTPFLGCWHWLRHGESSQQEDCYTESKTKPMYNVFHNHFKGKIKMHFVAHIYPFIEWDTPTCSVLASARALPVWSSDAGAR